MHRDMHLVVDFLVRALQLLAIFGIVCATTVVVTFLMVEAVSLVPEQVLPSLCSVILFSTLPYIGILRSPLRSPITLPYHTSLLHSPITLPGIGLLGLLQSPVGDFQVNAPIQSAPVRSSAPSPRAQEFQLSFAGLHAHHRIVFPHTDARAPSLRIECGPWCTGRPSHECRVFVARRTGGTLA